MWTLFFTFVIYWMVAFVACFTVVEMAQDQLYDEVTPRAGLKVTAAALILAAVTTYFHPSFDTMFTTDILKTVLQGIVWFGVFTLVLQFHPWHALGIGLLTMVLATPLATMGVDSMTRRSSGAQGPTLQRGNLPVRQSLGAPPAPKTAAPAAGQPAGKR